MIVHGLEVFGACVRPTEAKAELIADTNAVLARPPPLVTRRVIIGQDYLRSTRRQPQQEPVASESIEMVSIT